jgi:hypothetical protein
MKPFRDSAPTRTYTAKHSYYHDYKVPLSKDFNQRCGYTDCSDSWFGGKDNFHIDHFIPWKKHLDRPSLKTDYSNLVYCCSYVNIAKSNDEGALYLDPCNDDYNKHFQRTDNGIIIPLSKEAKYMYKKMKLSLRRFQIIWLLDQLESRMNKLQDIIEKSNDDIAKKLYISVSFEFNNYRKYLNNINA